MKNNILNKLCSFLDELTFRVWALIIWFSIIAVSLWTVNGILSVVKG